MNRKVIALLLGGFSLLLLATFFYGLFYASDPQSIPSALIGKEAKNFTLTTFEGQTIELKQFRGKPVVLNFWASWCVACKAEAHIMEAAHQKYTPRGAVFIGIAFNDKREDSLAFIRRYGKTYLLGPDNEVGDISLNYGITAAPETFFIDEQGIIVHKVLGAVTPEVIRDFLEERLP